MLYDRCMRCGRKLKDPAARQIGMGSVCAKKGLNKSTTSSSHKKVVKGMSYNKLFEVDDEDKDVRSGTDE